jgi:negative regulator of sigma E activity
MKKQPDTHQESLWRGNHSEAERAALPARPELVEEARLTAALMKLPDAPVPSNFTARVLETIELDENRQAQTHDWRWNWRALWPRLTVATAVLIVAGVSIQRYEANARRADLAKNLALVASAQSPGVDALENLETIQQMSRSAHADGDLLAALQ